MLHDLLLLIHIASAATLFGGRLVLLLLGWQLASMPGMLPVLKRIYQLEHIIFGLCFVLQPVTGLILVHLTGFSLSDGWISVSIGLYGLALCLWLVELALRNDGLRALHEDPGALALPKMRASFAASACTLAALAGAIAVMALKP